MGHSDIQKNTNEHHTENIYEDISKIHEFFEKIAAGQLQLMFTASAMLQKYERHPAIYELFGAAFKEAISKGKKWNKENPMEKAYRVLLSLREGYENDLTSPLGMAVRKISRLEENGITDKFEIHVGDIKEKTEYLLSISPSDEMDEKLMGNILKHLGCPAGLRFDISGKITAEEDVELSNSFQKMAEIYGASMISKEEISINCYSKNLGLYIKNVLIALRGIEQLKKSNPQEILAENQAYISNCA